MGLAAVLRCRDVKAFAAICLLGVGATCPAFAEPFPNWDINRAALYASTGLIECATLIPASEEDREIVAAKPEVVFNQYVIWETAARNYLTDHWTEYSEYIQLSNLEEVIDIAVRKSNEDPCDGSPRRMGDPSPSYISLLRLMPGGWDVVMDIIHTRLWQPRGSLRA